MKQREENTVAMSNMLSVAGRYFQHLSTGWSLCVLLSLVCLYLAGRVLVLALTEPEMPEISLPAISGLREEGTPAVYPEPASGGDIAHLDETAIDAVLLGVIDGRDRAYVTISVNGGREKLYQVGDKLAADVVIERIADGQVAVRERGGLRRIRLKALSDEQAGQTIVESAMRSTKNFAETAAPIKAVPAVTDTGKGGLKIVALDETMQRVGALNVGDVVFAVNDRPLSSLLSDKAVLQALANEQQLQVSVLRNDLELQLALEGKLLLNWLSTQQRYQ